jgi:hypothetical protein
VRRLEEKKSKLEKDVGDVPARDMEADTSGMSSDTGPGRQPAGKESQTDEPGYWVGMNPEDSSDTDMNKSRFAVWPSEEKGEGTVSSASPEETERASRFSREATEKMARVGHELHGSDEVVLPGGAIKTQAPDTGEGGTRKAGTGEEEFSTRVRKGDTGKHSGEWRIVTGKSEPIRRHAGKDTGEDPMGDTKSRQERDL